MTDTQAINDKLAEACKEAVSAMKKEKSAGFDDIIARLEWCVGSYAHDGVASGLHEIGTSALQAMKDYKEANPRKVAKKTLDKIEKALKKFEESQALAEA